MPSYRHCTHRRKYLLGVVLLIIVDILWVISIELTQYSTDADSEGKEDHQVNGTKDEQEVNIVYEPLQTPWLETIKWTELPKREEIRKVGDKSNPKKSKKRVSFNTQRMVCKMPDNYSAEARLARLSYNDTLALEKKLYNSMAPMYTFTILKVAIFVVTPWFVTNVVFAEALTSTDVLTINMFVALSGIFVMVLSFACNNAESEAFTLSKFLAIVVSLSGVAMLLFGNLKITNKWPLSAFLACIGALSFTGYLLFVKRSVLTKTQISTPLIFGYVGLFAMLTTWPMLIGINYAHFEPFEFPPIQVLLLLLIDALLNSFIGFLWLWSSVLTSSIMAVASLNLTIPLTVIVNVVVKKEKFEAIYVGGGILVLLSYLALCWACYYDNWDPVCCIFRQLLTCFKRKVLRLFCFTSCR
ncbi:uncharacterized protein TRIADDRAFT_54142 [Trichoplax adhaerens]|uniref:EamA domain-containing protein n=1 Tax=Trichoplax adhaerens TaxID=10228 RepID=B3RR82_TRIAD|nr:hypothetical protein TRIADDRAFT_54142 [Trichoplax adhaerens]EDV26830.1 hypothetical protein TRIADDRAFT_54142 [Trichoplax adhaerens]|eukprot:XP_002110826.1 hypothetical protein TRIADDRAFT_54142 [Trichoplax adhaerens]